MSRVQLIARNMGATAIYQVISIVFGIVIPQLFLSTYGPELHGLTSLITNVMSYVLLLNAGLNTASVQALYEPIAKNDINHVNSIFKAIKRQYFNIGIVYIVAVAFVSISLPFFVKDVSFNMVMFLVIVMGFQSVIDAFLISSGRILLQANQELSIYTVISTLVFVIRGIVQIVFINYKFSPILVQSVPTVTSILTYVLLVIFIKKTYHHINIKDVEPNNKALSKRWSALVHELASLVLNNTDVVILTISTGNMILVSIYSIYEFIFSHIHGLIVTLFSTSSVASFGNIIASGSQKDVLKAYNLYEFFYYGFITFVYSMTGVMILDFVSLYTSSVENVKYVDPLLAMLFIVFGVANNLRVPGTTMISAAGHFKETKNRAIVEMSINLVASLILFHFFSIYGLVLGTILSFIYRTTDVIIYINAKILKTSSKRSFLRALKVILTIIFIIFLCSSVFNFAISSWYMWLLKAIISSILAIIVIILINYVSERSYTTLVYQQVMKRIKHR